jgi:hypothetical protein
MSQTTDYIKAYIAQLSPQEQKVLKIAQEHLETSFNIVKSIGFQEWRAKQPIPTVVSTGTVSMLPLLRSKI